MPSSASDNPFNVNTSTAMRFGAGGALAGVSLATLLGLAKVLKDMKKKKDPSESTEDQLVLTLPRRVKRAEALVDHIVCENIARTVPTFGPDMEKTANWQTLVASLLAAGGGGMAGYALIDKLFEMKRMRELESQVEQAKEEYLDKLMLAGEDEKIGMAKQAGLSDLFGDRQGEPSFSKLDYPMGIAVLAALLGAGGSAWLTKRFLDKQDEDDFKPPKPIRVKRVVFKTAAAEEKEASDREIDPEILPAALGVFLDICSGEPTVVGSEKVAEAMQELDMKPSDLYKQAGEDFDRFILTLKQSPQLRKQLRDMSMDVHPVLRYFKWAAGLPFLSDMADSRLYDELSYEYGPRRADNPLNIKYASVLDSLIGSMAAEKALDSARGVLSNGQPAEEKPELEDIIRELEIGAADPNAEEFVAQNKAKIVAVLQRLAEEGKL